RHRAPVGAATAALAAEVAAPRPAVAPPTDPHVELDPVESTILAQRKRIMGRKLSLVAVARVATEIGPLVARALQQPEVQGDLQALAASAGVPAADYKRSFQGKQE